MFGTIPLLGGEGGRAKAYAGGGVFVFVFFNGEPWGEILGEGEGTDGVEQSMWQIMRC